MTAFWQSIVDDPVAFPPKLWQLSLQSSINTLREIGRPVCVGITYRRLITAGAIRQWWPRLEEVTREVKQFGVAVPGGVEHVSLRDGSTRNRQLARFHRMFERLQNRSRDSGACSCGQLRASAHAPSAQVLRYKTR